MGDPSVLVVDDDPAVRQLTTITLLEAGFDVVEAASGPEALALFQDRIVDLVVLDNSMPGMTGRDVARAIRAMDFNESVPIVMLSALASDEDQWEGWRSGVDVYVTKPYEPDDLVAQVSRLLRERAASA